MSEPTRQPPGQILLIDADDTLWENESYFRRVFTQFLDIMEDRGWPREDALRELRAVEFQRCQRYGYGSLNFAESMKQVVLVMEGEPCSELSDRIDAMVQWILDHPVLPFDVVEHALDELASRHRLLLVTKGAYAEQNDKVERSGFRRFFSAVEILEEKDEKRYRGIVTRHELDPERTWMIGNSPKSDINMAMAAGVKAIFIPHRTIWELEQQPFIRPPDRELERFTELLDHF